ncbi:CYT protein, partial [Amia calva]|nr:CYT protein [Amia calva]
MALFTLRLCALLSAAVLCISAGPLPGPVPGPMPVDPNSEGVREAADYATVHFNLGSHDKYIYKVTAVLDVQVQIVGGVKYTMDVELGKTRCENGRTPNLEACALFHTPAEARSLRCHFVVLSDPLTDQDTILQSQCQPLPQ